MNPESMQNDLSITCGLESMRDLHKPDGPHGLQLTKKLAVPFGVETPNPFSVSPSFCKPPSSPRNNANVNYFWFLRTSLAVKPGEAAFLQGRPVWGCSWAAQGRLHHHRSNPLDRAPGPRGCQLLLQQRSASPGLTRIPRSAARAHWPPRPPDPPRLRGPRCKPGARTRCRSTCAAGRGLSAAFPSPAARSRLLWQPHRRARLRPARPPPPALRWRPPARDSF